MAKNWNTSPDPTGDTPNRITEANVAPEPSQAPERPSQETTKELVSKIVASAGGPRRHGIARLPDGSFRFDITIPVEIAAALEAQAEGAEIPLEQYIQDQVVAALESYYGSTAA